MMALALIIASLAAATVLCNAIEANKAVELAKLQAAPPTAGGDPEQAARQVH